MSATNLLICTDLDGTLLDHHDYSFCAAQDALNLIEKLQIPLILNTSKTLAEVEVIRNRLCNRHPFIVENGAGVVIPSGYFHNLDASQYEQRNGYQLKSFGEGLQHAIDCLRRVRKEYGFKFRGFSEMTPSQIAHLTGLNTGQAQQAKNRQFSEPLLWQDTEQRRKKFIGILQQYKLQVVRGGRFSHVSDGSNKGLALSWLKHQYTNQWRQIPRVIALGDGQNDIPMLEIADVAIVVRSPVNPLPILPNHKDLRITDQNGPAGWNESLLHLLQQDLSR